jgi:hypothetical protein
MTAMKTAVVKDFIYFSEGPTDQPPVVSDPTHFGMKVMVLIGTDDDRPGDAFDAFPCTGSWLAAELAAGKAGRLSDDLVTEHDEGVWPLAGVWVMDRWSQERFEAAVRQLCRTHSPAPDWGTLASRIGRLLPWEYDYRFDDFVDAHPGPTFPPCDATPAVDGSGGPEPPCGHPLT